MARLLTALIGLMILAPQVAFGFGIDVAWDDCAQGVSSVKHFACNLNTGSDDLIGSFEPFDVIPDVSGVQATLQFFFRDGFIPSWWQTAAPGGCRVGGLTVTGVFDQQSACADPWQGQALAGPVVVEYAPIGNPGRMRLTISLAVPTAAAFSVVPGTVYYAYRLQVRHSKTVGTGSCSGCELPALIMAEQTLITSFTSEAQNIAIPLGLGYACWQCDCLLASEGGIDFGSCQLTPVPNHTWGGIKAIYR